MVLMISQDCTLTITPTGVSLDPVNAKVLTVETPNTWKRWRHALLFEYRSVCKKAIVNVGARSETKEGYIERPGVGQYQRFCSKIVKCKDPIKYINFNML